MRVGGNTTKRDTCPGPCRGFSSARPPGLPVEYLFKASTSKYITKYCAAYGVNRTRAYAWSQKLPCCSGKAQTTCPAYEARDASKNHSGRSLALERVNYSAPLFRIHRQQY